MRRVQILFITCFTLVGAGVFYRFDGISNFIAYTRGEDSVVNLVQMKHPAGSGVRVQNLAFDPISILSYTTSCSCVGIADLPVDVPPGETVILPVAGGIGDRDSITLTLLVQDTAGIREKQVKIVASDSTKQGSQSPPSQVRSRL